MPKYRIIFGIDYGTTFTSTSYWFHAYNAYRPRAAVGDVRTIKNWPYDQNNGDRTQVPTETWYPTTPLLRNTNRITDDDIDNLGESIYTRDKFHPLVPKDNQTQQRVNDSDDESDILYNNGSDDSKFHFGYAVHQKEYIENTTRPANLRIKRSKLYLLDTSCTVNDRDMVTEKIDGLIQDGIIRKHGRDDADERYVLDIYTDFLIKILQHAKEQLTMLHGFSEDWTVEFALTVPIAWTPAGSRVLEVAVMEAARLVRFGNMATTKYPILPYIVSEPEAAAVCMLSGNQDVLPTETFILADCGGGTVDMTTYQLDGSYPLRLKAEVVEPGGDNCGSSYLNENYKALLMERLQGESYLFETESLETIVNRCIPNFEHNLKRHIDATQRSGTRWRVYIKGLREDAEKRFGMDHLNIDRRDCHRIWYPLLVRVKRVLQDQLIAAKAKRLPVQKVFLIGGFGISPSLKSYVRNYLQEFSQAYGNEIRLISGSCVTAISIGAVLGALNKANGPGRVAQSSYGWNVHEPYMPNLLKAHKAHDDAKERYTEHCDIDGDDYIDAIDYFVVRGTTLSASETFGPIHSVHTFPIDAEALICQELIFVSDTATKSHYHCQHEENKDANIAARLQFDMTSLRDEGKLQQTDPIYNFRGQRHWKVEYNLYAKLEGKTLRYYAEPLGEGGKPFGSGQISIAAAFLPGTK